MESTSKPQCLGFIMDGNRRFAKEHNLPTLEGHRQGKEVFIECVKWLREIQIAHGVFYAFSTENWKRTPEEVAYLMELFAQSIKTMLDELKEEGVRVRFIGRRQDFSEALQAHMNELEEKTRQFDATTIWIALSYGGRAEIVEAVNAAVRQVKEIDETSFETLLATADMPDPDMIVRTSGEYRLSNFLTWKSVYSELYFIEKHWPALTKADLQDILLQYEKRQRRLGA